MGYSYRNNGNIKDFWPDDTATVFYLSGSDYTLGQLMEEAQERWGADINYQDVGISVQNIHTWCLTYDQHDPSDYTLFIVVELLKE